MWKFDPIICDIVWFPVKTIVDGNLSFGSSSSDDLALDCGDRTVSGSIIDSGSRIIDGSF